MVWVQEEGTPLKGREKSVIQGKLIQLGIGMCVSLTLCFTGSTGVVNNRKMQTLEIVFYGI